MLASCLENKKVRGFVETIKQVNQAKVANKPEQLAREEVLDANRELNMAHIAEDQAREEEEDITGLRTEPKTTNVPVDREEGFDEETGREQGSRCLICTLNPVFDGELCILCNGCVDVCPMDCLKLVPLSSLEADEGVTAIIGRQTMEWSKASAMLLDPTRCIRCGLCAARCPTEAVRMESFRFTEEVKFEEVNLTT